MTDKVGHTVGPWYADFHNEQRNGGRFITHILGGNQLVPIAAVPTGVEGYGREEGRANARLIASAPDLLEALKDVTAHLVAAHSLLSKSPKTAAPSDRMFDQMLRDYKKSFERGRKALSLYGDER